MNVASCRLAIALCTRDRPIELLRACRSVTASCRAGGVVAQAALVVDGGPLSPEEAAEVQVALAGAAERVEHIDVAARSKSLYQSRLIALGRARELGATHVAFFDDDVEATAGYMALLAGHVERGVAGVGGVDLELRMPGRASHAWNRLIAVSSGDAGRLSASGFGGSMPLWSTRAEPFASEYLSGCNMTLDVRVLDHVSPEADALFVRYSLGEDLYLSSRAARVGALVIDPRMTVRHRRSAAARDDRFAHGRQFMVNSAWLARETGRSRGLFAWSALGLAARAGVQDIALGRPKGRMLGMLAGAPAAARLLLGRGRR